EGDFRSHPVETRCGQSSRRRPETLRARSAEAQAELVPATPNRGCQSNKVWVTLLTRRLLQHRPESREAVCSAWTSPTQSGRICHGDKSRYPGCRRRHPLLAGVPRLGRPDRKNPVLHLEIAAVPFVSRGLCGRKHAPPAAQSRLAPGATLEKS